MFSAANKLVQLCQRISRAQQRGCQKRHEKPFRCCAKDVVYEIPLSSSEFYIGKTGSCINAWLREHDSSTGRSDGAHLTEHRKTCSCVPRFEQVKIIGKSRDQTVRELTEAFHTRSKQSACVSDTSVMLYTSEVCFLINIFCDDMLDAPLSLYCVCLEVFLVLYF